MTYTKQYFIDKFSAIPDESLTKKEVRELRKLFSLAGMSLISVSEGFDLRFKQHRPKARILAALELVEE